MNPATVRVRVKKSRQAKRLRLVRFVVDSGVPYSIVAGKTLRELGCTPYRKKKFLLEDGSSITRKIGDAYFEYRGVGGPTPVVFGEDDDRNLLGTTTLWALGLVLNPFTRKLRRTNMNLITTVPGPRAKRGRRG